MAIAWLATATTTGSKTINMRSIDRYGNETSPLFSIDDKRRHRMVVDYEENKFMLADKPDAWHTLPVTKKGLLTIPLTKEICDRHASSSAPPPPEPLVQRRNFRHTHGLCMWSGGLPDKPLTVRQRAV